MTSSDGFNIISSAAFTTHGICCLPMNGTRVSSSVCIAVADSKSEIFKLYTSGRADY